MNNYCELWDIDTSEDEAIDQDEDCAKMDRSSKNHPHYYSRLFAIFILSWQYKFGISDSAIGALAHFIQILLSLINKVVGTQFITNMLDSFPKSVIQCRKILEISAKGFEKYVTCVKCHSIYQYDMTCYA